VDIQRIDENLWGKVGPEVLKKGMNYEGFDLARHGWTLIRNKSTIFWEPLDVGEDFGIPETKFE
jgi:hypothetical protein